MTNERKAYYGTGNGQKELMAESVGQERNHWIGGRIKITAGDYGCDVLGNGMFRMVPSGDIVDYEERCKRLNKKNR